MGHKGILVALLCGVLTACGGSATGGTGGVGGNAGTGGTGGIGGSAGTGGVGGDAGTGGTGGIGGDPGTGGTGGIGGDAGTGGTGGIGGDAGTGGIGGDAGTGGIGGDAGSGGTGGEPGPTCGNGDLDDGEECDLGVDNNDTLPDGCRTDCTLARCGDGVQDSDETCDDGNQTDGDGCSSSCAIEGGWTCAGSSCVPTCGDGLVVGAEECDGEDLGETTCVDFGGNVGAVTCDSTCKVDGSACSLVELCDNGVDDTGDGLADCEDPTCARDPLCAFCGNGFQDGDEACDGLDLAGQSCLTQGFDGGTLLCGATCGFDTAGCFTAVCGDGVRQGKEACDGSDLNRKKCSDFGFNSGTLSCDAGCAIDTSECFNVEICGNGIDDDRNGLADCEDPTCSASLDTCPVCGDGVITGYEECEDGNSDDGDGCNSACQLERWICDPNMVNLNTDATPTANGFTYQGNSIGMGNHVTPTCQRNTTEDVTLAYAVTERSRILLSLSGPSVDTVISVRTNCADDATELACADGGGSGTTETATLADVPAGTMLYIAADRFGASNSGAAFTLTAIVSPIRQVGEACGSNDICPSGNTCDAVTSVCVPSVCGDGVVTSGEDCDDSSDPTCVDCKRLGQSCALPFDLNTMATAAGEWTWTGELTAGGPSTYDTCGSKPTSSPDRTAAFVPPVSGSYTFTMTAGFDEFLHLYTGACGSLTQLVCSDSKTFTKQLVAGEIYYVVADAYGVGKPGPFTYTVKLNPVCGDGFTSPSERCDGEPGCSANCMVLDDCGNGTVDPGEECDDGNLSLGDGCGLACIVEAGWSCAGGACESICGDHLVVGAEECDDSSPDCVNCGLPGRSCRNPLDMTAMEAGQGFWSWEGDTTGFPDTHPTASCTSSGSHNPDATATFTAPVTGSYVFDMETPFTSFDDLLHVYSGTCGALAELGCVDTGAVTVQLAEGQTVFVVPDGYGSSRNSGRFVVTAKLVPACGNHFVSPGERCDGEPDCSPDCQVLAGCGNGVPEGNEQCDDGNLVLGDGCGLGCMSEPGWACGSAPCEPVCGDGMVVGREQCDVGHISAGMTCSASCEYDEAPLPVDGDSLTLTGTVAVGGPTWDRPTAICVPNQTAHYTSFTFTNTSADDVWVEAVATWQDFDGFLHAYATPFGPSDSATNCLVGNDDFSSIDNSKVLWKVTAGDSIVIVASGYDVRDLGGFELAVSTIAIIEGTELEPNNDVSSATPMQLPSLIAGSLPAGDADYYAFDATAGTSYTFETYTGAIGVCTKGSDLGTGTGTSTDTKLWILDAAGTELVSDDNGGVGTCSRLTWTAPTDATFFVRARHYSATTGTIIDPYWITGRVAQTSP